MTASNDQLKRLWEGVEKLHQAMPSRAKLMDELRDLYEQANGAFEHLASVKSQRDALGRAAFSAAKAIKSGVKGRQGKELWRTLIAAHTRSEELDRAIAQAVVDYRTRFVIFRDRVAAAWGEAEKHGRRAG
jgi:hypothetical protein